jgi:hypothetical protein
MDTLLDVFLDCTRGFFDASIEGIAAMLAGKFVCRVLATALDNTMKEGWLSSESGAGSPYFRVGTRSECGSRSEGGYTPAPK